jgi:hypothetical protein
MCSDCWQRTCHGASVQLCRTSAITLLAVTALLLAMWFLSPFTGLTISALWSVCCFVVAAVCWGAGLVYSTLSTAGLKTTLRKETLYGELLDEYPEAQLVEFEAYVNSVREEERGRPDWLNAGSA